MVRVAFLYNEHGPVTLVIGGVFIYIGLRTIITDFIFFLDKLADLRLVLHDAAENKDLDRARGPLSGVHLGQSPYR